MLVAEDAAFTPVFERLEAELAATVREETRLSDVQRQPRTLLDQNAIPRTSFCDVFQERALAIPCLLYTSDAADE